ncbi:carboxymuconolactone decarboxylase family protein [Streptomyces sp. NPDC055400]
MPERCTGSFQAGSLDGLDHLALEDEEEGEHGYHRDHGGGRTWWSALEILRGLIIRSCGWYGSPRHRQPIPRLAALGGCEIELEVRINATLKRRPAMCEIFEVLLHSAAYCATPPSINASIVAKKVFAERELLPEPPGVGL